MAGFFKGFGKGILYLFVLPFLLVFLVFYGIYGLGVFLVMFVKSVILFFTGRSLDDDLPEDKKAKEILDVNKPKDVVVESQQAPAPQATNDPFIMYKPMVDPTIAPDESYNPNPYDAPTVEEGLFGKKEEIKEEKPLPEETIIEEEIPQDIAPEYENKIEEPISNPQTETNGFEEIITSGSDDANKYQPRGIEDFSIDEVEEEESDDGVGISFDRD